MATRREDTLFLGTCESCNLTRLLTCRAVAQTVNTHGDTAAETQQSDNGVEGETFRREKSKL